MTRIVEFFFDFMSPPTYLAYTQLPGLMARTRAAVVWKPMYTIGLHQLTGNQSPILVPAKGAWIVKDLARYVKRYGIEFVPNSHQPVKVVPSLRGAIVAQEIGCFDRYVSALFAGMWTKNLNIGDPAVLKEILLEAGLDAAAILEGIERPEVKAKLVANTQEAANRGAFGAPSFFVGDDLYWGQDRLEFVEEALLAR